VVFVAGRRVLKITSPKDLVYVEPTIHRPPDVLTKIKPKTTNKSYTIYKGWDASRNPLVLPQNVSEPCKGGYNFFQLPTASLLFLTSEPKHSNKECQTAQFTEISPLRNPWIHLVSTPTVEKCPLKHREFHDLYSRPQRGCVNSQGWRSGLPWGRKENDLQPKGVAAGFMSVLNRAFSIRYHRRNSNWTRRSHKPTSTTYCQ